MEKKCETCWNYRQEKDWKQPRCTEERCQMHNLDCSSNAFTDALKQIDVIVKNTKMTDSLKVLSIRELLYDADQMCAFEPHGEFYCKYWR